MILPALITATVLGTLYATRGPVARLARGRRYYMRVLQGEPVLSKAQIETELLALRPEAAQSGMVDLHAGKVTREYADFHFRWAGANGAPPPALVEGSDNAHGPYEVLW